MAYTQTDLSNVTSAIVALATGERVVTVRTGNRETTYQQADLDKLRALKVEIEAELNAAAGGRRFVLTSSSKGAY